MGGGNDVSGGFVGARVVVTGGSRGVGAALVNAFLAAGASVVTCHRGGPASGEAPLDNAAGRGWVVRADVTDEADTARLADVCLDRLGGVDVLVNNVGVDGHAGIGEMGPAEWSRVIGANLTAAYLVTRRLLPLLHTGSSVINIGASAALRGRPTGAHYTASKAGLLGLTRSLAKELGAQGIRVNVVAPGVVPAADEPMPDGLRQQLMARIPLGRFGTVDDVVASVLFLAGEEARYVSGAVLAVDGGM
jgi:3-oxoacyl-[acyl-carrier protein] reductase